jgi:hypothetical protein
MGDERRREDVSAKKTKTKQDQLSHPPSNNRTEGRAQLSQKTGQPEG